MRQALRAWMRVPAHAPRPARAWYAACAAVALATLLSAGCARVPGRPPGPPRPRPGYERLRDTLAAVDASGLAGRRIVLDPGHGGFFRGALGVRGLTEAEVNLGVALRLRDLLVRSGARVLLTRESDRDLLTPADSSLRADLAERVRIARAFDPDLFVSIHHNADAGGAHDVNETQTYYRLGDDGPSLDVAQDVHRALVRNVGIVANRVVPGNFHVLRGNEAPAILTETSYITFPGAERRLRRPEKQALEAEALFVGLARYFARPVPVIEEFVEDRARAAHESPPMHWEWWPVLRARVRGDFDGARLEVDGQPRPLTRVGPGLAWRPDRALESGSHEAVLRVRLSGVGSSRERRLRFEIRRPVHTFIVDVWPDAADTSGGLVGIRVRPLDTYGLSVRDTVQVRMQPQCPCDAPEDTTLTIVGGEGWAYVRVAPLSPHRALGCSGIGYHVWGRRADLHAYPAAGPTDVLARLEFEKDRRLPGYRTRVAFLVRMPDGSPLTDPPGRSAGDDAHPWVNRDGFAVFELDSTGRATVPALPGYRVWPDSASEAGAPPVRWTAIAGGALHGRRIVLDPEGGGGDAAGQGPGGTRAAHLNLESARILAGLLAAAGAEVRLTREGDLAVSDVERVQASEAFRAERFLRLAHRAEAARLGHYPASATGRAWAARSAAVLAALGLPAPAVGEDAQYVVSQTSCPSLFASPSSLGDASSEARLLAPGALRSEAYALFVALAREWAPQAAWPADSLTVLDAGGRPVPGAAVTLGGTLVLESDALGRVRFLRTEPGGMEVAVDDPRVQVRTLLLESQRGAVLTGKTGR